MLVHFNYLFVTYYIYKSSFFQQKFIFSFHCLFRLWLCFKMSQNTDKETNYCQLASSLSQSLNNDRTQKLRKILNSPSHFDQFIHDIPLSHAFPSLLFFCCKLMLPLYYSALLVLCQLRKKITTLLYFYISVVFSFNLLNLHKENITCQL